MPDHARFAAFVMSHGRPDRCITVRALANAGYTGALYVVIDDEDPTAEAYRERYGAAVIQFDKAAVAETFDAADTSTDRRTVVYARNACFEIARELGLDYFLELDDDYVSFIHRSRAGGKMARDFDAIVEAMLTFLDESGAAALAMSQGGDHMGGTDSTALRRGLLRKAMNAIFLRTDQPVRFVGRINEDVNTYVLAGSRGALFLTVAALQLNQLQTQGNAGGMTDVYLDSGTYVKSFYSVMMAPSCMQIRTMGRTDRRLHHRIEWESAVPKILSESHRREAPDGE